MTIIANHARISTRSSDSIGDLVDHLHTLGPDILAEFLTEAVDPVDLELELLRYGRLDPRDLCGAACLAGYPADPKRRN
jgi:hypothetical protein